MSPEGQETASLWAAVRRWAGAGRRRRAELEARIAFQLQCLPHYYMPGIGAGELVGTGEELVRLLRRVGGLRRDDRVLDLGCGLARVGIPLQRVLTSGSYDGVDVVEGIILRPVGPIRWGRWSGRSKGLSYQDVLVLRRE